MIPHGYCQCGCGNHTPIANATRASTGTVKGQPQRFCVGHHAPGWRSGPYKTQVPLEERFWPKVDKTPGGCWLWTASRNRHGYGRVWSGGARSRGKWLAAHRVSYEISNGPIPEGLDVLHTCDNPPCVNPDHLFAGTQGDNNRDRHAKRRDGSLPGSQNPRARLSQADVDQIRGLWKAGVMTQTALAEKFGIKQPQVSRIVRGTTWRV